MFAEPSLRQRPEVGPYDPALQSRGCLSLPRYLGIRALGIESDQKQRCTSGRSPGATEHPREPRHASHEKADDLGGRVHHVTRGGPDRRRLSGRVRRQRRLGGVGITACGIERRLRAHGSGRPGARPARSVRHGAISPESGTDPGLGPSRSAGIRAGYSAPRSSLSKTITCSSAVDSPRIDSISW